jgi:hypothetical protein
MKVVIAGSRSINEWGHVYTAIKRSGFIIYEVVTGKANGVDMLGEFYAEIKGLPLKEFPVTKEDWATLGRGAGPIRNRKMAEYADAAIVVWDGRSKGSLSMINEMKRLGKPCFVWKVEEAYDE